MLVLTRKPDQSIIINDGDIEIVVISVKGGRVKLGIEAHKDIPIYRQEVYEQIKKNGENNDKKKMP